MGITRTGSANGLARAASASALRRTPSASGSLNGRSIKPQPENNPPVPAASLDAWIHNASEKG